MQKISFIARDVTDPRAFGFVFGTPDSKHQFYAIKTEKTADHLVLSIRDMFHIVYEMKKKQIEAAKQQGSDKEAAEKNGPRVENADEGSKNGEVAVGNLLDLETELKEIETVRIYLNQRCGGGVGS